MCGRLRHAEPVHPRRTIGGGGDQQAAYKGHVQHGAAGVVDLYVGREGAALRVPQLHAAATATRGRHQPVAGRHGAHSAADSQRPSVAAAQRAAAHLGAAFAARQCPQRTGHERAAARVVARVNAQRDLAGARLCTRAHLSQRERRSQWDPATATRHEECSGAADVAREKHAAVGYRERTGALVERAAQ